MMHMLVADVDAWWSKVNQSGVVPKYGVKLWPIEIQPWKMRDFVLLTQRVFYGVLGKILLKCIPR